MIILVIFAVSLVLITGWGGQSNDAVGGLFKFFESLLAGKTLEAPNLPG